MIELASALRAEVARAAAVLADFTEAEATRSRGPGKWVKKQILGHLCDSAANNHQRFVRAQFASPFHWPGYEQEAWVEVQRYASRPWQELLDLWVALNRHLAAVIESVPADRLATPCRIGTGEPAPLEWWMRDYLRHLKHHLAQLEEA
jgi:hypothetical protein